MKIASLWAQSMSFATTLHGQIAVVQINPCQPIDRLIDRPNGPRQGVKWLVSSNCLLK